MVQSQISKNQNLLVVNNCIQRLDRKWSDNKYYKYVDNFSGQAILKHLTVVISKQYNHPALLWRKNI